MIRMIVAMDPRRGIARNGHIPWDLPADRAHFKHATQGSTLVMGHTTYQTIGRPLPDRKNVVVSRSPRHIKGVTVVSDPAAYCQSAKLDVWIIGGEALYQELMVYTEELYITELEADFECDQFFPNFNSQFQLVSRSKRHMEHGIPYSYQVWARTAPQHSATS